MVSSTKRGGIQCGLYLPRPMDVRSFGSQLAGVTGPDIIDVVAAAQPIHLELVNLLADEKAIRMFVSRWGGFIHSDEPPHTLRQLHSMLWIDRDAEVVQALVQAHPEDYDTRNFFLEDRHRIIKFRNILRKAWDRDEVALEDVRADATKSVASAWSFKNGRIEIQARDAWTAACILFLRDYESGRTAVCGNTGDAVKAKCAAPYFLKNKPTDKFCSPECADFGRRKNKRDSWGTHREEWNKNRRKKVRDRRRKKR